MPKTPNRDNAPTWDDTQESIPSWDTTAPTSSDPTWDDTSDATPSVAPGVFGALGTNPNVTERSQDLNAAVGAGYRGSITGGLGKLVGATPTTPEEMAANPVDATGQPIQYDFEPKNAAETAAYIAGNTVLDPVGGFGALKAGQYALRATGLMSKAERLAALNLATQAKPAVQAMSRAVSTATGAVEGAAGAGVVSGAQEAIQQLARGEFDPEALAYQTAFGTVAGAGAGAAVGRYGANKLNRLKEVQNNARQSYEGNLKFSKELDILPFTKDTEGLFGEAFSQKVARNRQEMLSLHNKISVTESAREGALAKASTAKTTEESAKWNSKAANHLLENAELQNQFNDKFGGEAYSAVMKLKRAYGNTKVKIKGEDVPMFDYAIGRSGVVVDPEAAKAAMSMKDISKLQGSIFSSKDPMRMLIESEGLGGPMQRAIMDGLAMGDELVQKEFSEFSTKFESLAKAAGIKRFTWTDKIPGAGGAQARETSKKIFQAIEKGDSSKLAPAERELTSYIKVHYENMLNRINKVRLENNLTPIKRRNNYISHIVDMKDLEESGINMATSDVLNPSPELARKIGMRFEQDRTGAKAMEDVYSALTGYTSSALRTIHNTRPRQQALALVELMDSAPNLQAGLTRHLNGPVYGGVGHIDSIALANGGEKAVDFADYFSGMIGRSAIAGNLKVMADQASQVLPTIAQSGLKYAPAGVRAVLEGVPPELRAMSRVLSQRNIAASEGGHQLGRAQRNLVSRGVGKFDKVLQGAMEATDSKMAEFSWMSAFQQGKQSLQLSDKAAAKYADDVARSLNGIYRDLYRPILLQNRLVKGFWPFQTFSFNLWNALTTDAKAFGALRGTGQVKEAAKLLGAMEATNLIYSQLAGGKAPFDFGAADVFSYGTNDMGEVTFKDKTLKQLRDQPSAYTARDVLPSLGPLGVSPVPMALQIGADGIEALKAAHKFAFDEDADLEKAYQDFQDKTAQFGSRFIPYGAQIYRTRKAMQDLQQGYTTIGKQEVPLEGRDVAPSLIYGSSNAPSVRDARKANFNR